MPSDKMQTLILFSLLFDLSLSTMAMVDAFKTDDAPNAICWRLTVIQLKNEKTKTTSTIINLVCGQ